MSWHGSIELTTSVRGEQDKHTPQHKIDIGNKLHRIPNSNNTTAFFITFPLEVRKLMLLWHACSV